MAYDHADQGSPKRRSRLGECFSCCFGGGSGGAGEKDLSRRRIARRRRSYDPLSYALNFDEGPDFDDDGGEISPAEFRYRNFSSRLPPTPPHLIPAESAAAKGIACN
ncbi:unnamed protein product [Spirodela intermedia]|uniref:Uncharacterized protein n=1 Tax=Spirodela intermedia TaxID=51605 RepID=A0A7I8JR80_SPIIN|nr:unnamed protein product [Spirodela intermedia]CAA6672275.1 unnamed protein product [Spirodela intermedia]